MQSRQIPLCQAVDAIDGQAFFTAGDGVKFNSLRIVMIKVPYLVDGKELLFDTMKAEGIVEVRIFIAPTLVSLVIAPDAMKFCGLANHRSKSPFATSRTAIELARSKRRQYDFAETRFQENVRVDQAHPVGFDFLDTHVFGATRMKRGCVLHAHHGHVRKGLIDLVSGRFGTRVIDNHTTRLRLGHHSR